MSHLRTLMTVAVLTGVGSPAYAATDERLSAPVASSSSTVLVARPATIDFKTKRVGTENYKRTKITNSSRSPVRLVVTGGLPDDFGFGLMPGETCPVFDLGEVVAAGASCYAVVRFSPTDGFIGWPAEGSLDATATDPDTGALVDKISIPVLGMAVL